MCKAYLDHIPAWMCQRENMQGLTGALASDICDGMTVTQAVYGSQLASQSGLIAFAYLWRRFGPPWIGSDEHKDLVTYILGTSHPEVSLTLHLSGSPLEYGVGYMITRTLLKMLEASSRSWERAFETWWADAKALPDEQRLLRLTARAFNPQRLPVECDALLLQLREHFENDRWNGVIVKEAEAIIGPYPHMHRGEEASVVTKAMSDALQELLRPVWVRDVAINILGIVEDDAMSDTQEQADPSPYAGLGVPKGAMDALLRKETP